MARPPGDILDGIKVFLYRRTMENDLEKILQGRTMPIEDIVRVARAIVHVDSMTRDAFGNEDSIPFVVRLFAASLFIVSVAEGVDPDLSYLSEALGVPRPTLHRWANFLEAKGLLKFKRVGRRKVLIAEQLDPRMITILETVAAYHEVGPTNKPLCC